MLQRSTWLLAVSNHDVEALEAWIGCGLDFLANYELMVGKRLFRCAGVGNRPIPPGSALRHDVLGQPEGQHVVAVFAHPFDAYAGGTQSRGQANRDNSQGNEHLQQGETLGGWFHVPSPDADTD